MTTKRDREHQELAFYAVCLARIYLDEANDALHDLDLETELDRERSLWRAGRSAEPA